LRDAYIAINGTAVSDHASSVELEDTADQIDFTGFSTAGYKQYGQGLHDAKITCTFFSDFAALNINSILQPLYASGGTFSIEVRPTSSVVSSTNPKATMTCSLFSYSGISGKIGDASTFDAVFQNAGTAGLVWGTT
jgi:hypothetical protein